MVAATFLSVDIWSLLYIGPYNILIMAAIIIAI